VRLSALDALNRIAPDDERFLSTLGALLTDKHKEVRFRAPNFCRIKTEIHSGFVRYVDGAITGAGGYGPVARYCTASQGRPEAAVVVPGSH